MTYEEIVKKAKQAAKNIDAKTINEHIAIQIDIEGEGEGAFYVEASEGKIAVEPYEYYENDCKIKADAETIIAVLSGKVKAEDAVSDGRLQVEGDAGKALTIINARKTPEKNPATKKAPAKKAPAKKPAAKKAPVKKTTTKN